MRCRSVILTPVIAGFAALALLSACSQSRRPPAADPGTSAPSTQTRSTPSAPSKDWKALAKRVRNREEREKQILSLLDEAEDARKESEGATGEEKKKLVTKAKDLYAEAGDVYDLLKEEVEQIDKQLWNQEFGAVQNRWDLRSKKLARLGL